MSEVEQKNLHFYENLSRRSCPCGLIIKPSIILVTCKKPLLRILNHKVLTESKLHFFESTPNTNTIISKHFFTIHLFHLIYFNIKTNWEFLRTFVTIHRSVIMKTNPKSNFEKNHKIKKPKTSFRNAKISQNVNMTRTIFADRGRCASHSHKFSDYTFQLKDLFVNFSKPHREGSFSFSPLFAMCFFLFIFSRFEPFFALVFRLGKRPVCRARKCHRRTPYEPQLCLIYVTRFWSCKGFQQYSNTLQRA